MQSSSNVGENHIIGNSFLCIYIIWNVFFVVVNWMLTSYDHSVVFMKMYVSIKESINFIFNFRIKMTEDDLTFDISITIFACEGEERQWHAWRQFHYGSVRILVDCVSSYGGRNLQHLLSPSTAQKCIIVVVPLM